MVWTRMEDQWEKKPQNYIQKDPNFVKTISLPPKKKLFLMMIIKSVDQFQPIPVFSPGKIPWMVEPGRLQSTGSQRVGHD